MSKRFCLFGAVCLCVCFAGSLAAQTPVIDHLPPSTGPESFLKDVAVAIKELAAALKMLVGVTVTWDIGPHALTAVVILAVASVLIAGSFQRRREWSVRS